MSGIVYSSENQRQIWRIVPDLVRAREILWDLISQNLRIRYRDATIGFAWAVLEPLAMTAILTLVFTFAFANRAPLVDVEGQPPFALLILSGLVLWQFLAAGLARATRCLLEHQNLVNKVYFPREIIPIATIGCVLVDFVIGLAVLFLMLAVFGGAWGWSMLWLFVVCAVEIPLVLGLALLCSYGNVYHRDIGFIVNVFTMLGFYCTPVFYPYEWISNNLPPWAAQLYLLNPMAGLITVARQALFGLRTPDLSLLAWPAVAALALLMLGVVLFRRAGPTISDRL